MNHGNGRIVSSLWIVMVVMVMAAQSLSHASDNQGSSEPVQERGQETPPLELIHSGETHISTLTSESGERYRVTDLSDSVLFKQGDQYILADRATFHDQQEEISLWGRVQGWDPTWRFWADEVIYRGKERLIVATGHVRALNREDGSQVDANQIRFDRETGEGLATGSPRLYQPPSDSTDSATEVTGGEDSRLSFRRDEGWAEMSDGAEVRRGEMRIIGLWLRSEDEPRILLVRDDVELEKGGVSASCANLNWNEETGLARLTGDHPVLNRLAPREEGSGDSVWTTMSADSLDLQLTDDVLESIFLHGPGEVVSYTIPAPGSTMPGPDSTRVPAQPEHMRLVGKDIAVTLEEERLRYLSANRAAMYYWRKDLPGRQSAMGGMKLLVTFEGGEPVEIEARGNAVTRYFSSMEEEESSMVKALAALIRLNVEDGEFTTASLENGTAVLYSADVMRQGIVSMAVHPDSVQVGASRRPGAQRGSIPPFQQKGIH